MLEPVSCDNGRAFPEFLEVAAVGRELLYVAMSDQVGMFPGSALRELSTQLRRFRVDATRRIAGRAIEGLAGLRVSPRAVGGAGRPAPGWRRQVITTQSAVRGRVGGWVRAVP